MAKRETPTDRLQIMRDERIQRLKDQKAGEQRLAGKPEEKQRLAGKPKIDHLAEEIAELSKPIYEKKKTASPKEVARELGYLDSLKEKQNSAKEEYIQIEVDRETGDVDLVGGEGSDYMSAAIKYGESWDYLNDDNDDDKEPARKTEKGGIVGWIYYIGLIIWLPIAGYGLAADWDGRIVMWYWTLGHPVVLFGFAYAYIQNTGRFPWPWSAFVKDHGGEAPMD